NDCDRAGHDGLEIKNPARAIHDVGQNAHEIYVTRSRRKWRGVRLGKEISQIENDLCDHEVEAESGWRHFGNPFFDKALAKTVNDPPARKRWRVDGTDRILRPGFRP